MPALGTQSTLVTHYIRSLRGGSQPILAEASDGNIYVVKFAGNLQGPHLPFNDSMGTELYRACGLPTTPWKALKVCNSFLDRNPACWLETPEGRRKPTAGLCLGSRFLGDQGTTLFEVLPGSYFQRVENAADFWLAWLVDVCTNHSDARQAIFCEKPSRQLAAVFIDFGYMFGGGTGTDPFRDSRQSRYRDRRIYPRINSGALRTLRKTVNTMDTDQVFRQLAVLPDEWKTRSAIQNLTRCLDCLSDISTTERTQDEMVKSHQLDASENLHPSCGRNTASASLHPGVQPLARNRRAVAQ